MEKKSILALTVLGFTSVVMAQQPLNWTAAEDHQNMLDQLGIKTLRPGVSGKENAPNHANYDESKAIPFPDLPDPLQLNNGQRVTSAKLWWRKRRPEIIEYFEREVYGRIPPNVPRVAWSVVDSTKSTMGSHTVITRQMIGRVDNSLCPQIEVTIKMTVVTPADASGPVPLMIMLVFPSRPNSAATTTHVSVVAPGAQPLIDDGWGYATILPTTIQADNGAGLTKGIIGLVNKGQARKPDDWGALRAWAWGASRALDYFETDKTVDARRVGIEGVSRYGKAAVVGMAFDSRFAVALVASSGEGGTKPHRRNFGEIVENLSGAGEYHWMAGNFLKYGAAEATFGSMNAGNLPVDSHELIALCAPRPIFISYGSPEHGDPKWGDAHGSYMAAVAAGKVFKLLGAKGLGTSDDYMKEQMPAINTGLLNGQVAWRQHDAGHTDGPNWPYFIPWADKFLGHPGPRAEITTH